MSDTENFAKNFMMLVLQPLKIFHALYNVEVELYAELQTIQHGEVLQFVRITSSSSRLSALMRSLEDTVVQRDGAVHHQPNRHDVHSYPMTLMRSTLRRRES